LSNCGNGLVQIIFFLSKPGDFQCVCNNKRMKKTRPRDFNQLAKTIVDITTGEIEEGETELTAKRREAGRLGAKARAKTLTEKQRSDIARKAAEARWSKPN